MFRTTTSFLPALLALTIEEEGGDGAAGGGSPPAGTGGDGGDGGDGAAGGDGGGADWLAGVTDPAVRKIAEDNGFKGVDAVLKSYDAAHKRLGVPPDQLVRWPSKAITEDADAYKPILERLGLPTGDDAHAKYELPDVDGVFQFADAAEREAAAKGMHAIGVLPHQAKALVEQVYAPIIKAQQERAAAEAVQATEKAETELKTEWGAAFDDNLAMAAEVELALPEEFQTFLVQNRLNSNPHMIRLLHEVAKARQEGSAPPAQRDGAGADKPLTPAEMDARLDEFETRHEKALNDRSHPEHASRVKERMAIIKRGTAAA